MSLVDKDLRKFNMTRIYAENYIDTWFKVPRATM